MIKIGITGSLASGKTTASQILSHRRGPLFSADKIVKKLYKDKDFKKLLSKTFNIKKYSITVESTTTASISTTDGFNFTGKDLKEISKSKIEGVNIKTQDTTPSYNFGEGGN